MLAREGVALEAKVCAMGVRVEHPPTLINKLMYFKGRDTGIPGYRDTEELIRYIGNASYSLVTQVNGRGVYSFCMCPGGHIVPAGSIAEGCVVNLS